MTKTRAGINAAAAAIATKLGLVVGERAKGYDYLTWRLLDAAGAYAGRIQLSVQRGYNPQGTWWAGHADVQVGPYEGPMVTIASEQVCRPWGMLRGAEAKRASNVAFCRWASRLDLAAHKAPAVGAA